MPDTVTLTLDAAQYYRELAKVTAQNQRLAKTGEEIGSGFLRGDRAVRVATANIVQGLTSTTTAADGALIAMQSLERVFKIPIGATIVAAGVIAALEVINKEVEKQIQLREDIRKISRESSIGGDFESQERINRSLSETSNKIKEVAKSLGDLREHRSFQFGPIDFLTTFGRNALANQAEEQLTELHESAARDVLKLTEKTNDLNKIELERLDHANTRADLDKLSVEHNEKLGDLAQKITDSELAGTEAAKQLFSVENDRYNVALRILGVKLQTKAIEASVAPGSVPSEINQFQQSLARKVNLGPLFLNQAGQAEDLSRAQARQGDLVESERLHRISQEMLEKANDVNAGRALLESNARVRLGIVGDSGSQVKPGFNQLADTLQTLSGLSFQGLKDVSRLQFLGLQVLDGITISIK